MRRRSPKPRRGAPRRRRQGDYRVFVGAFPKGEIAERLQAVREQYDPQTAAITPPHVTLAGTYWRQGEPAAANEAETIHRLEQHVGQIDPFDLVLGGVRRFGHRVVYLGVKPSDELVAARKILLKVLGPDKHRRFTPHLTLAMRISPAEMDEMVADLQVTAWESERWTVPIRELRLMLRGPEDDAWRGIADFSLA
jgi:2'-5' RNA ligase